MSDSLIPTGDVDARRLIADMKYQIDERMAEMCDKVRSQRHRRCDHRRTRDRRIQIPFNRHLTYPYCCSLFLKYLYMAFNTECPVKRNEK